MRGDRKPPNPEDLPEEYWKEKIAWDGPGGVKQLNKPGHYTGKFRGCEFEAWLDSQGSYRHDNIWSVAVKMGDVYLRTFGHGGGIRKSREGVSLLVRCAAWITETPD